MAGSIRQIYWERDRGNMTKRNLTITLTAAIASLIASAPQMVAKTAGSVTVAQEARETLKEAADNTQGAIHFFNTNRTHLWSSDYQAYAQKVESDSNQIAKTLQNYLK